MAILEVDSKSENVTIIELVEEHELANVDVCNVDHVGKRGT